MELTPGAVQAPRVVRFPREVMVIDLSGCTDLTLCADQLDPAAIVNCAAKTVSKVSDRQGAVTFTLLGGSNGSGNATTLLSGAKLYGNGALFGEPTVSALDLDGVNGVGVNDLSVWLTAFGSGASSQGCAASCP